MSVLPLPFRTLGSALGLSLLLHAVVLGWPAFKPQKAKRPPPLEARLLPSLPALPTEPLLKNTLAAEEHPTPPAPSPPPPSPKPGHGTKAAKLEQTKEQAALKKLAEHLYYPEAAVDQGLEGEVRLLLALDAQGRILSAEVAVGSGHPILDKAALAAARTMGSLPDAGVREFILPVVFKLQ